MKTNSLCLLIPFAALIFLNLQADARECKGHKFKGTIHSVGNGKLTIQNDEDEASTDFVVPSQALSCEVNNWRT